MIKFDLNRMLFTLTPEEHDEETVRSKLEAHPEVRFVSFTGVDMGNHQTDEKIPVSAFTAHIKKLLEDGVQTDGSSVALPTIADLSNARVDIVPNHDVNWYVEYNYDNIDYESGLPTGTLRIPSFLRHNGDKMVGSRVFLKDAVERFTKRLHELLRNNPYVFEHIGGVPSYEKIDELVLKNATELEFWVKTPDDKADRDQLSIAQELKEQYWQRVSGPVATAMEQTLEILGHYGFGVEMGHKEVGGVKAKMGNSGNFDHIMEQLEIDWQYAGPMQAADNEILVRSLVKEIFRSNGLEVSFLAKPIYGVAGSGEHTHVGLAAKLKNGKIVNIMSPADMKNDYLSAIGYGALMGILKNYEVLNPIVSCTTDAFARLRPGFEAPICIVTSLGKTAAVPTRNRTVLAGVIRDIDNPLATRFEVRAPNPFTNTYMALTGFYLAALDGIKAVLASGKSTKELEAEISKKPGEESFYLEKDRAYRSEVDVFEDYTPEERDEYFGKPPATVWENMKALDEYPDKVAVLTASDILKPVYLESFKEGALIRWQTELLTHIIPKDRDAVKAMKPADGTTSAWDDGMWQRVEELRVAIAKDTDTSTSLFTQIKKAFAAGDFDKASDLQVTLNAKMEELEALYTDYSNNII